MAEAIAETTQQEREELYAALKCTASFHCLVEQWKDCEELKPKPREKWILWIRKGRRRSIGRNGVRKQIGIDA